MPKPTSRVRSGSWLDKYGSVRADDYAKNAFRCGLGSIHVDRAVNVNGREKTTKTAHPLYLYTGDGCIVATWPAFWNARAARAPTAPIWLRSVLQPTGFNI
jgi:hypothetical protein